jgi:cytidyltransferase-like protein
MKSFLEVLREEESGGVHHVMTFGRMNPPTTGHLKVIDKVKEIAKKHGADHTVVVSHSQDAKKNPLSSEQKLKHIKRYSPDTHFEASSKEHPTFLQHAAKLHKKGVTHLHMVVGSDRVKEMHDKLHQYNGTHTGALYNFKKITVHSAGQRDPDAEGTEGMSGTKMREHAKNKDLSSFKKGVPAHVPEHHVKELMHDVRKGMGLHESTNRGQGKAIFVTGGPGSGKDVVIRECIAEQKIVELNFQQIMDIMNDKHKLAMRSMNPKMEAIRHRGPLIINGPADDYEKISHIKEELEELGYQTMMVFVDTTDKVSQERNTLLTRMMLESTRHVRWSEAQKNIEQFSELFEYFSCFDNTGNLEEKVDDITELFVETTKFLDEGSIQFTSSNKFIQIYESSKSIQHSNLKNKGLNVLKDNNSPVMQFAAKLGRKDDVRDGDIKMNTGYTPRIGGGSTYAEDSEPKMIKMPEPKVANFNKDANIIKTKKLGNRSLSAGRIGNVDGVGSSFDTRGGSSGAANAGLGDNTYHESTDYNNDDVADFASEKRGVIVNPLAEKNKKLKKFKESIFDFGQGDSGVGGTLGGAGNKEDFVTPQQKFGQSGITIKKKKIGAK